MSRDRERRFLAAGDTALVVEYGAIIDSALIAQVQALDRAVAAAGLPGVIETVPSFRSLLIQYDPLTTGHDAVAAAVAAIDIQPYLASSAGARWELPCAFGGELGPDLSAVAAATGMALADLIDAFCATEFIVGMIGFLPGCPYLVGLDESFDLPRRSEPRLRVAPGSVAVAQRLSVIYPAASPGGWHLIGNCPQRLFDPENPRPALLAPGDAVRFHQIDAATHRRLAETAGLPPAAAG
jgi:inhibitor of KinA